MASRMRWFLAVVLAGSLGAAGARLSTAGEEAAATPAQQLAEAQALLDRGEAAAAEALLGPLARMLGEAPSSDAGLLEQALLSLAGARLAQGRTYAALEPLEALARSGSPRHLVAYADALLAHARAVMASEGALGTQVAPFLEDARRSLARVPPSEAAALGAGWLEGEQAYLVGNLALAVEHWDRAQAAADPQRAPRWYLERRAHALYGLGRHAQAAEAYEALGQVRGAAAAWSAAREAERSLALYARLLEQQPADEALLQEALAAARFSGGEARLEALLAALDPADPEARVALVLARARLRLVLRDRAGAVELLASTREGLTGPGLARVCAQEAVARLDDPALDEAGRERIAGLVLQGWAQSPADPTLAGLAAYLVQRDFRSAPNAWPDARPIQRALRLQRAAVEALPEDPLAWANLGNVARLAGGLDEALAAFQQSLSLGGPDAGTRNDMALVLLSRGERDGAEAAMRLALEEDAGQLSARQNLARHLYVQGPAQAREARSHLLEAERRARADGSPALVFRSLSLKAWRAQRGPLAGPR